MGQADLGELIEKASREYPESMVDIRNEADRVRGRGDGEEILKFTVLLNLITSALTKRDFAKRIKRKGFLPIWEESRRIKYDSKQAIQAAIVLTVIVVGFALMHYFGGRP